MLYIHKYIGFSESAKHFSASVSEAGGLGVEPPDATYPNKI